MPKTIITSSNNHLELHMLLENTNLNNDISDDTIKNIVHPDEINHTKQ